jgi:hypothetical protein
MNWENITMNEFENVTVYKNQYVKVKSVKVKIPLNYSEEDEVKFTSTNKELIHLFINQNPIFSNSDYTQCWNKLVEVIVKDNSLTQQQKCLFENWNAFGISLHMGDWVAPNKGEADNYKYTQREKLFEYLNGNKDTTAKNYWRISAEYQLNSPLLKPLFTSIT